MDFMMMTLQYRFLLPLSFALVSIVVPRTASAKTIGVIEKVDSDSDPFVNISAGFSAFSGAIGIEFQQQKHSVTFGLPGILSYRYYQNPYRNTKFLGVTLGKWNNDEYDDTFEGVFYNENKVQYLGIGAGYRWQWYSGWNASVSLSVERYKDTYSSPSRGAEETGISIFPGAAVGFKF